MPNDGWAYLVATVCQRYNVLPVEIWNMRLKDLELLITEPEAIKERYKYTVMSDEVKRKYEALKRENMLRGLR